MTMPTAGVIRTGAGGSFPIFGTGPYGASGSFGAGNTFASNPSNTFASPINFPTATNITPLYPSSNSGYQNQFGGDQSSNANTLAQQIATDLVNNANTTTAANTAPATPVATAVATTDNPFMDWLGLSNTPTVDMITGVPNWILAAGGIGLVIWLTTKGERK